jgi:hypothetical protein
MGLSTEREREKGSQIDDNLHHCRWSTPARVLSNGERSWFPWRRGPAVREGVEGKQMNGRGGFQRVLRAL